VPLSTAGWRAACEDKLTASVREPTAGSRSAAECIAAALNHVSAAFSSPIQAAGARPVQLPSVMLRGRWRGRASCRRRAA